MSREHRVVWWSVDGKRHETEFFPDEKAAHEKATEIVAANAPIWRIFVQGREYENAEIGVSLMEALNIPGSELRIQKSWGNHDWMWQIRYRNGATGKVIIREGEALQSTLDLVALRYLSGDSDKGYEDYCRSM